MRVTEESKIDIGELSDWLIKSEHWWVYDDDDDDDDDLFLT